MRGFQEQGQRNQEIKENALWFVEGVNRAWIDIHQGPRLIRDEDGNLTQRTSGDGSSIQPPEIFYDAYPELKEIRENPFKKGGEPITLVDSDLYNGEDYRIAAFTTNTGEENLIINGKLVGDRGAMITIALEFLDPKYIDYLLEELESIKGEVSPDGSKFFKNVIKKLFGRELLKNHDAFHYPFSFSAKLVEFKDMRVKEELPDTDSRNRF